MNDSTIKHESTLIVGVLEETEDGNHQHASNKESTKNNNNYVKKIVAACGILGGFVACFTTINDDNLINQTLACAIWMATLWLTELIPLVVTAFMPLFLFPFFGILSASDVAAQYINDTIILMIAGFMIALTLQRWYLHERFSLKLLTFCGTRPSFLLLGMMGATFILSMFISNTAATLMMVPNAIAVVETLENSGNKKFRENGKSFSMAVVLGIAYSASVGGMSSLIGTATNLALQQQLALLFPSAPPLTFASWMAFGLPTGLALFIVIWAYLCFVYLKGFSSNNASSASIDGQQSQSSSTEDDAMLKTLFKDQYLALGDWSWEEKSVAFWFFLLCVLWFFGADFDFGSFVLPSWVDIFPEPSYISDSTSGMLVVFILFTWPARSSYLERTPSDTKVCTTSDAADCEKGLETISLDDNEQNDDENDERSNVKNGVTICKTRIQNMITLVKECDTTLLDWKTANKMHYDIVFLLGGGFALAQAFQTSGLSQTLGEALAGINMPLLAMVSVLTFMIVWLTELTSNSSTANIMIPIAAALAVSSQVSPYTYMIPVTLACSCAFALPIATPPNMIAFSTGKLPIKEMNKAGLFLNFVSVLVIVAVSFTIVPAVLGVPADAFPEWADTTNSTNM